MNNKRLGTAFEREFCELLAARGFWVHFMSPSASGAQPCDIIACRNNTPYLFDCKTCDDEVFRLSRLEDNQMLAFEKFYKTGNKNCFIAVKHKGKIYQVNYECLKALKKIELDDCILIKDWFLLLKNGLVFD